MNDPRRVKDDFAAALPAMLVAIATLLALVHGLARAGHP
jgi:hypothetical protein